VVRSIMVQTSDIKPISPIRKKYANILEVPSDSINNEKLYKFIDRWLQTPYLKNGKDSLAVNSAFFACNLYSKVYKSILPTTTKSQFSDENIYLFKGRKYLKEGDLIFFKSPGTNNITHVGIYLKNNRFVHSTARQAKNGKNGVQVSRLDELYWDETFVAGGKVKIKQ